MKSGETTRLLEFDLSANLHVIAIEIGDERGDHVTTRVDLSVPDGDDVTRTRRTGSSSFVFRALTPQVDVVVSAPERTTTTFRGVSSGARLTLAALEPG